MSLITFKIPLSVASFVIREVSSSLKIYIFDETFSIEYCIDFLSFFFVSFKRLSSFSIYGPPPT